MAFFSEGEHTCTSVSLFPHALARRPMDSLWVDWGPSPRFSDLYLVCLCRRMWYAEAYHHWISVSGISSLPLTRLVGPRLRVM
jgi:hypothetical protein